MTFSDCVHFHKRQKTSLLQMGEAKPKECKLRHRFELPWLNLSRITSWIRRAKKYRLMTHSLELSWAEGDEWSKSNTKGEEKCVSNESTTLLRKAISLLLLCSPFAQAKLPRHVHKSINFLLSWTKQTLLELKNHHRWQLLICCFSRNRHSVYLSHGDEHNAITI